VVDVFSPVTAFISVNGVTAACAEAICKFSTADIRNVGAAAFYRYFTWFIQF
jgi:hypothetical protein